MFDEATRKAFIEWRRERLREQRQERLLWVLMAVVAVLEVAAYFWIGG